MKPTCSRASGRASVLCLALLVLCGVTPTPASAEVLTFHMPAQDVLASVATYNAFVASLGKRARRVKLVPGGTLFAGHTCAAFGGVYKLGAVTVLDGPGALRDLVLSRNGRDAEALESVFRAAGVGTWTPPATAAEGNIPFWTGAGAAHGIRFAADGMARGSDEGLLGSPVGPGVLRFQANVTGSPDAHGRYRFLIEVYGKTSSDDSGLVALADRRCFTFVDLRPIDVSALGALVDRVVHVQSLRAGLQNRIETLQLAIDQRDLEAALETLAVFTTLSVSRVPDLISEAASRQLVEGAFHVRRGLLFSPASATCGNGVRETGEACDGADLGGFDCNRLGYQGGTLSCTSDCRFLTSSCIANPVCGNGIVEVGEQCDNGVPPNCGIQGCNSDTTPGACRTNCKRASCGDGVIDSFFEDCEGNDLGGETCEGLGYDGGTLRCESDICYFDDERCFDREED